MSRYNSFVEWLEANPYPDLGALVEKHRLYSLIPPEEWEKYDAECARWRAAARFREYD